MYDPCGPLGIALSLPGLVLTCVQYYELFESFIHARKELAAIAPLFGYQRIRFQSWQTQFMPDGESLLTTDVAKENLTIAIVDQIEMTFLKAQNLARDHGERKLYTWEVKRPSKEARTEKVSPLQNIAWALRGENEAKTLLDLLKSYNEALDAVWNRSADAVARQVIPELEGFNTVSGLLLIEEALAREDDERSRDLHYSVRLRRIALENAEGKGRGDALLSGWESIQSTKRLKLGARDIEGSDQFSSNNLPSSATLRGQQVLLEWKAYKTQPPLGVDDQEYKDTISDSIRELACMLAEFKPRRLRALDCVGFRSIASNDPYRRVCFAFSIPSETTSQNVTLHHLIQNQNWYLGGRFDLGRELAATVYQVLHAGWLHKGISSRAVKFFNPLAAADKWQPDAIKFYLTGYEFSRPINQPALSSKPHLTTEDAAWYQHPDYRNGSQTGYRPMFDLYSLGVVLVEIALWRTAGQLVKECNMDPKREEIPLQSWRAVLNLLQGKVKEKAGLTYAEAVRRCIEGDLGDGVSDSDPKVFLKAFDKLVVAELEKCCA